MQRNHEMQYYIDESHETKEKKKLDRSSQKKLTDLTGGNSTDLRMISIFDIMIFMNMAKMREPAVCERLREFGRTERSIQCMRDSEQNMVKMREAVYSDSKFAE